MLQLLFQEANPGVRYEYTISQNVSEKNNTPLSVFYWKYGSWTECSVTCGTGKRNSFAIHKWANVRGVREIMAENVPHATIFACGGIETVLMMMVERTVQNLP